MPDLRSPNGCWTCKLRRKKCDERQPRCLACETLEIPCDGYGLRPDWLDGDERAQRLERIKIAVKNTTLRKRRGLKSRSRSTPIGIPRVGIAPSPSTSAANSTFVCANQPRHDGFGHSAIEQQELEALPEIFPLYLQNTTSETAATDLFRTHPANGFMDAQTPLTRTSSLSNFESFGNSADDFSILPEPLLDYDISLQHTSDSATLLSSHVSLPPAFDHEFGTALLVYYLDNLFPILFPLWNQAGQDNDRGWLLVLANRSKSLYYSILTLCTYHQQACNLNGDAGVGKPNDLWRTFHALALHEFRNHMERQEIFHHLSPRERFKMNIEGLACVAHLIFLQVACLVYTLIDKN
jgi:hypothetical protein